MRKLCQCSKFNHSTFFWSRSAFGSMAVQAINSVSWTLVCVGSPHQQQLLPLSVGCDDNGLQSKTNADAGIKRFYSSITVVLWLMLKVTLSWSTCGSPFCSPATHKVQSSLRCFLWKWTNTLPVKGMYYSLRQLSTASATPQLHEEVHKRFASDKSSPDELWQWYLLVGAQHFVYRRNWVSRE